jgi:hypothetical protein
VRRLFVALAAVVGDVKAGAFEDQPGAAADAAPDFAFAPLLALAFVGRAQSQRGLDDRLLVLERVPAFFAGVFVSWQGVNSSR